MVRLVILFLFLFYPAVSIAQLNSSFSASVASGCSPLVVTFSDNSTGNPTSWFWDLGNGNTSTLQNPSAVYNAPGTYSISLTVFNGPNSSTFTQNAMITVFPSPVVNFSANILSNNCGNQSVQFLNSTTGAVSWQWSFGDGGVSNQQSPQHTYTTGNYSVSLIATSPNGCSSSSTQTNLISVPNNIVTASFTNSASSSCATPFNVNFSSTSTGPAGINYSWNFGNGQSSALQNPSATYNSFGNYNVSLTVTDPASNCSSTISQNSLVQISNNFQADFSSVTTTCVGAPVQFTNLSTPTPTASTWNFGDGTSSNLINPIKIYNTPGTYTVTLSASASSGCSDIETRPAYIVVQPAVQANFTAPVQFSCDVPSQITFNNTSTSATSYSWNFGNGSTSTSPNPTATFDTAGTYDIQLIATSPYGCSDTLLLPGFIQISPPVASFSVLNGQGCLPVNAQFNSTSTSVDPIISYAWNFGNGQTGTGATSNQTYPNFGLYNVQLIITTASGCSDTIQQNNAIASGLPPVAAFTRTMNTACVGQNIVFTNQSINGLIYAWNWGDGTPNSISLNANHSYSNPGVYTVTLTASSPGCGVSSVSQQITVLDPRANFSYVQPCSNLNQITFTDLSIGATSWTWNFGDGTIQTFNTSQNPTHTYTSFGNFTVVLTVSNSTTGCSHSRSVVIAVPNQNLDMSFTPASGCGSVSVQFTNLSVGYSFYRWLFSDGTLITGIPTNPSTMNPLKTFGPGTYTVRLVGYRTFNGVQCRDTVVYNNIITVNPLPVAAFSSGQVTGCNPYSVSFTNTSSGANSYQWNFGNGTTSNSTSPTATFTSSGTFNVRLIAINSSTGCRDTVFQQITVPPAPALNFTVADSVICANQTALFTSFVDPVFTSAFWNFGDGTTGTGFNPSHTYGPGGPYTVTLTGITAAGCSTSVTRTAYISISTPIAGFSAINTIGACPPLNVTFSDQSSPDVISWNWNFGTGAGSALQNPGYVYVFPGSYDVSLIVTNAEGCSDTITQLNLVQINGPVLASYSISDTTLCPGQSIDIQLNTSPGVNILTDLGDGSSFETVASFSHIYQNTGIFNLTTILSSSVGGTNCVVTYPLAAIDVQLIPVSAGPDQTVCEGVPAPLNATGGISYSWSPSTGLSSISSQAVTALPSVTTDYVVSVFDADGCFNSDTVRVNIMPAPNASISFTNACAGNPVSLNDNSTIISGSVQSYSWNFGNGQSSTQPQNSVLYNISQPYTVSLIATSDLGCNDTAILNFTPFPVPDAAFTITNPCLNSPILFTDTSLPGTGSIQNWNWNLTNPSGITQSFNSSQATFNTSVGGIYTMGLNVTNSQGCTDTVIQNFTLQQVIAYAGNPVIICSGQFTQLTAYTQSGYQFSWSPPDYLSNPNISNPILTPSVSGSYILTVTDAQGCISSDTLFVTVNPVPVASFTANPMETSVFNPLIQFTNTSSGADTYTWIFGDGQGSNVISPEHSYQEAGNYSVDLTVENAFGCSDNFKLNIIVTPEGTLYVPSAFTPNDDYNNDSFRAVGVGISNFSMTIFDRWGEIIFESDDIQAAWNGRHAATGQLCQQDVYVYLIDYRDVDNIRRQIRGSVLLYR
jgi:gliding motility-associated-like protein